MSHSDQTAPTGRDNSEILGEFELIDWIRKQAPSSYPLVRGIGDDCAVEEVEAGYQLLTSTDLLIEDIHFKRAWTTMYDLGRKAAAVNLSDIAAMGGIPRTLYLAIGRPHGISTGDIKDLIRGFLKEAGDCRTQLAGGDTCASGGPLLIAVTAHGHVRQGHALYRGGACIGDAVYVSGTLGDSALALQQLQQGGLPEGLPAERFHTPTARVALAEKLAGERLVTAMLDVSDGMLADLHHILNASAVGADVELREIPLSTAFRQARDRGQASIDLALTGGEDYELLFTSARWDLATREDFQPRVTRIGTITACRGVRLLQDNGEQYYCQRAGFDHFRLQEAHGSGPGSDRE